MSFGCSTGEEVASLDALYLTGCHIVGLDVSSDAISAAAAHVVRTGRNQITFQTYDTFPVAAHTFHVVLALSVLCRWPDAEGKDNISELYGFREFSDQIESIDGLVEPGGVLVVHNSNYYFEDTRVFAMRYEPIHVDFNDIGFVTRYDTQSVRYSNSRPGYVFFRKRQIPLQ